MKYSALLFDLDGTLVHSMPLWNKVYVETLESIGIHINNDQFWKLYHTGFHFLDYVIDQGYTGDPHALKDKRDANYIELLRTQLEWIPGAKDVMEEVKHIDIPTGIITMSHRTYTDAMHKRMQIESYIDVLITTDDVERTKPHPEALLFACEQLQVEPKECVYIGDQIFDTAAARAAGMTSILIPDEFTPPKAIQEADIVVKDISELMQQLI